jgi:CHASE2 domain-containing sensor protein
MWKYLQMHEAFVRAALEGKQGELDWRQLKEFHLQQTRFMQHERLIHLLVLLTMALLLVLSIGYLSLAPSLPVFAMALLLLVLVAAYVVHYFRLENGVQRWYHLANRIDEKLGVVSARYNEEHPPPFL